MEEDFRPGKYRVSLTNENVNSLHDPFSNFLIRASRNEYFKYECGEFKKYFFVGSCKSFRYSTFLHNNHRDTRYVRNNYIDKNLSMKNIYFSKGRASTTT